MVVGQQQADLFNRDPQNLNYMKHAVSSESTQSAMDFARNITGAEKVLDFRRRAGRNKLEPAASGFSARQSPRSKSARGGRAYSKMAEAAWRGDCEDDRVIFFRDPGGISPLELQAGRRKPGF